jgi:uncharacterized damage-inducible protein DinB
MPNKDYVLMMARYNQWQNDSLVQAANSLSDSERAADKGSFFGSIQKTFSHILWGDQLWLNRFAGTPAPKSSIQQSVDHFADWDSFRAERTRFDAVILDWAKNVNVDWFSGDLSWFSGAMNRDISKPKKMLTIQMFNHQTHHRGQIHAMLTAAGAHPDDTDVPFMPEGY